MTTDRNTYFNRAQAEADAANAGRFATITATTVVASRAAVPHQPPGSPWHHDPVPAEPPLGFSINEMPVVGTPAEVARAAAMLKARSAWWRRR